jgi:hypothetical protein
MRSFITCILLQVIIRMTKSTRIKWAEHEERTGKRGMHIGHWWKVQKEIDDWEDQDVGRWIILKWVLQR